MASFNLMLVGSPKVGKTSIVNQLRQDCAPTGDGDDGHIVDCTLPNGRRVTIFDSSGAQKDHFHYFAFLCKTHTMDAFIFVFSEDSEKSLKDLPDLLEHVKAATTDYTNGLNLFLINNKRNTRTQVKPAEVKRFMEKNSVNQVFEIASLQDDVHKIFCDITNTLMKPTLSKSLPAATQQQVDNSATTHRQLLNKTQVESAVRRHEIGEIQSTPSGASELSLHEISELRDDLGRSILGVAARNGSLSSTATNLRSQDADEWTCLVNFADNAGMTPLMQAAAAGKLDNINWLCQNGAQVESKDRLSFTALTHAACRGRAEAVASLLSKNATPDVEDFCGNTPLIWAARGGYLQVIRELKGYLTPGRWTHRGEYGKTALDWAHYFNHRECMELISEQIQATASPALSDSLQPQSVDLLPPESPIQCNGEFYSMSSSHRGYAVMINNFRFSPNMNLEQRDGAEVDSLETGISQAFVKLGLTPKLFVNKPKDFFENLMQQTCPKETFNNHDAFVLFISSHGDLQSVYASDGERINLETIFDQVRRIPGLYGKPKVFIIQACRKPDQTEQSVSTVEHKPKPVADCLYLYSVVEGGVSLRLPNAGCVFTNAFKEVVCQQNTLPIDAFTELLPDVVDRVAKETKDRQIPTSTSTLRKRLYFPPVSQSFSAEVAEE